MFSPSGVASINRVEDGVLTNIATAAHSAGPRQWFDVELRAGAWTATLLVNGEVVFDSVLTDHTYELLYGSRMVPGAVRRVRLLSRVRL